MDSTQKASNAADTSFLGSSPQSEDVEIVQEFDTSLLGISVVEDPAIRSDTQMDVKAIEASEYTELSYTSDNIVQTENISDEKDDSNIPPTESMEPNAEMVLEENYLVDPQDFDNSLLDAIQIRDAFIFCPMPESVVLDETLGQGIHVCERQMTDLNENKNSMCNKFISIEFNKEDASKSKRQAIAEYLQDVVENAKEYESAVNVQGIFTYEDSVPVENWLLNSVENLKGHSIDLPTNWLDIAQLIHKQD